MEGNSEGGSMVDPNDVIPEERLIKPEPNYLKELVEAVKANNDIQKQIVAALGKLSTFTSTSASAKVIQAPTPVPTKPTLVPVKPAPVPQAPVPVKQAPVAGVVDEVMSSFPKELADLMLFEEVEQFVILRPRNYLGADKFAKIAGIIRQIGGEYISAGKESHFRVEKR